MSLKMRRVLLSFGAVVGVTIAVVAVLVLVAVGNTLMLEEIPSFANLDNIENSLTNEESEKFSRIMATSIQFKTVSTSPSRYDGEELLRLHQFLKTSFPTLYNSPYIDVETVNTYSLLFTVKGTDPGSERPFMLTSHMDVVPVDPNQWSKDPFLGEIVADPETGEEYIWGRGSIDDKVGVVGILSALESLLSSSWIPKRNFFVAFGHDEEVSGHDGAREIAKVLAGRNVTLDFLLDEGMPIIQDAIPGVDGPVALIGVSEKGRAEIQITAEGIGGHSSIPPKSQAVQKLASAVHNLYRNPQPSMFGSGPEGDFFRYLAPRAGWPYKLLFSNLWLFGPLLSLAMSLEGETDAFLRTTTAVTIVDAGIKSNVVPATGFARVNHRVHPSQSLDDVLAHDIAAIGDSDIKVELIEYTNPHPVSPYGPDSAPYQLIAGAVRSVYPDAVPAPSLLIANTDTISYLHLTPHIYRFAPVKLTKADVRTIHGKDERVSVANFISAVKFYKLVVLASEQPDLFEPRVGRLAGEL